MFTVPLTGVWRISFSLISQVGTRQENNVFIYKNQQRIGETQLGTYSEYKEVWFTAGRELITRAERGETFLLGTGRMWRSFWRINTCFEFVSL